MHVGYAEIAILSQYLASSRAVNAKYNTLSRNGPWRVYDTIVASKRRSLLMAGDDDEMLSIKKPQHYTEDNRAAFSFTR